MYLCCMKAIYMYVQFFLIKHLANENMCIYVCIFVCVKDQSMCENENSKKQCSMCELMRFELLFEIYKP